VPEFSSGRAFSRGAIYGILCNQTYRGEVVHKKKAAYPGEHAAIIGQELWERVQARLDANGHGRGASRTASRHLLAGLLYDGNGNRMSPSHAVKKGRRYRYYVSQALLQDRKHEAGAIARIAARAIEDIVVRVLDGHFQGTKPWARIATDSGDRAALLRERVARVELHADRVVVFPPQKTDGSDASDDASAPHDGVTVPIRLKMQGGARIVLPMEQVAGHRVRRDPRLIRALARAWRWREALTRNNAQTMASIAAQAGYTERYVRQMLQLAFLAPSIITTILEGRHGPELTLSRLRAHTIPISWASHLGLR
jgi:site-specific DNA recombinase